MTEPGPATLDLSPRDLPDARPRRRVGFGLVVAALVVVAGFVLWKGLSEATLFFLNADEAVEQRADLGDDRFRLQGTVVPGTVVEQATGVEFDVQFNGVSVAVVHTGAPPELFQDGIPVVLEGHWQGEVYASDEILVKHDEVYEEENADRLDDAEEGGQDSPSGDRSGPNRAEP